MRGATALYEIGAGGFRNNRISLAHLDLSCPWTSAMTGIWPDGLVTDAIHLVSREPDCREAIAPREQTVSGGPE